MKAYNARLNSTSVHRSAHAHGYLDETPREPRARGLLGSLKYHADALGFISILCGSNLESQLRPH
jgi:hypothetical protein